MDYAVEGAYRCGRYSGLITTVAAGTDSAGHLWAAEWLLSAAQQLTDRRRVAVIQRLRVRAKTISGFTAAQEFQIGLYKLNGVTATHAGGTVAAKEEKFNPVGMPNSLMSIRMANAAELTDGTHSALGDPLGADSYAELAAGATVPKGSAEIFMSTEDLTQFPFVLTSGEGLLVRNEVLMGAGGTVRLCVEMDWLELQRYPVPTYSISRSIV